jgi:hypothetical protein
VENRLGGPYPTKARALKRLRQVEHFKKVSNMDQQLVNLVFNLKPSGIRYEYLDGRQHLVADTNMLTQEVIEGSLGPIFYTDEENAKWVQSWDHKPAVVYHPEKDGKGVTAADPTILNSSRLGIILNTRYDKKLRTQTWLDVEKMDNLVPEIHKRLKAGEAIEVSTGLNIDLERTAGEYNGKKYIGIARNYRPDHLAILPDRTGAYSVAAGGGMGVVNEEAYNTRWTQAMREKLAKADFGDPANMSFPINNQEDLDSAAKLLGHANDPSTVRKRLIAIATRKGLKVPESWSKVANELSHSQLDCAIGIALRAKLEANGQRWGGWISDVFDDYIIYYENGQSFLLYYKADDNGVTFDGEPTAVELVSLYQTADGQQIGNNLKTEIEDMGKKEIIDGLLAANVGWEESDRPELMKMGEPQLGKMLSGAKPVKQPAVVTNTKVVNSPKPGDKWGEFIASAPAEFQEMIADVTAFNQQKRAEYIQTIIANGAAKGLEINAEALAEYKTDALQLMADLSAPERQQSVNNNRPLYRPVYQGAAGGPVTNGRAAQPPIPEPPVAIRK